MSITGLVVVLVQSYLLNAKRIHGRRLAQIRLQRSANHTETQVVATKASDLAGHIFGTRSDNRSDNLRRSSQMPVVERRGKCDGHKWYRGDFLDKGAYGSIEKVRKSGDVWEKYVMKAALDKRAQSDLESEISIMSQINCGGILPVIDPAPCDSTGNSIPYAFVMPQMIPNLWKWMDKYPGQKLQCRDTIQKQLSDALKCLHATNFVHGDLKGDQILYASVDPTTKCPVGMQLSDFGLAQPRYDTKGRSKWNGKFDDKYYKISGHLIDALFEETDKYPQRSPSDVLRLTHPEEKGFYRISTTIDWCSFLYEMLTELALGDNDWYNSLSIPENLKGMKCGWMSSRRNIFVQAGS